MKLSVCIGSACHLKGSRHVVESLQRLIADHGIGDKVELAANFCTGNCQKGVCVTLDGTLYSVSPETVGTFFQDEVLSKLQ